MRRFALYLLVARSSCRDAAFRDAACTATPLHLDIEKPSREAVLRGLERAQVRSVLYQRLYLAGGWERIASKVLKRVWPGLRTLEINCPDIGPGLVIGHGYGTVIWANRIGRDCVIHQGVTLGLKNDRYPTLGDRVWVSPGAVILGATVGDDALIGANAVVVDDVPAGERVGAPLAMPLRRTANRF